MTRRMPEVQAIFSYINKNIEKRADEKTQVARIPIVTHLRDRRGFRSHWAKTSAKNSDSCCQIWQTKTCASSLNKIWISWSSYLGQASKNYSLFLWSSDLIGCPVFYMSINLWYIWDPNLGRWDYYSSLGDALLFFSLSFFLLTEPHYIAKRGLKLSLLR